MQTRTHTQGGLLAESTRTKNSQAMSKKHISSQGSSQMFFWHNKIKENVCALKPASQRWWRKKICSCYKSLRSTLKSHRQQQFFSLSHSYAYIEDNNGTSNLYKQFERIACHAELKVQRVVCTIMFECMFACSWRTRIRCELC